MSADDDVKWAKSVASLVDSLSKVPTVSGATVEHLEQDDRKAGDDQIVHVLKKQTCLKRFQDIKSVNSFLVASGNDKVSKLNVTPKQFHGKSVVLEKESSFDAGTVVRVRSGNAKESDKELWIEVWHKDDGLVSSLKISDKLKFIYNDSIFGGLAWNKDSTKVTFIGEVPPPKKFKNFFDVESENDFNVKEKEKDKEKEKEKDEEHWMNEKFRLKESFGETLEKKSFPGIFIFDLKKNKLQGPLEIDIDQETHVQHPKFDMHDNIIFQGVTLRNKKVGLNFCLNHPSKIYLIEKHAMSEQEEGETKQEQGKKIEKEQKKQKLKPIVLTSDIFLSFNPILSNDLGRLVFFGRTNEFCSHSTTFELFSLDLSEGESNTKNVKTVIPVFKQYPKQEDQFAGIYGYQTSFANAGFVGNSDTLFVFQSPIKGKMKVFLVNLESGIVSQISTDFSDFNMDLIQFTKKTAIIAASRHDVPTMVHCVQLNEKDGSIERFEVLEKSKMPKPLQALTPIKQEEIQLENGAHAVLRYAAIPEDQTRDTRPMIVVLHGGPFGASPLNSFSMRNNVFLCLGFAILTINYRGSIGYGDDFLSKLVGNAGLADVEDCGDLTLEAIRKFGGSIIDPSRVGVFGGSHGGFLTGWLIGHEKYKDLFHCAVLWNPVLNLAFNLASTDIPDWIWACFFGENHNFYNLTEEEHVKLLKRSPTCVMENVTVPSLLIVGIEDQRVPPKQSYCFHAELKRRKIPTKLFEYPDSGHAISPCEFSVDANLQIFTWMSQHLLSTTTTTTITTTTTNA